MKKIAIIFNGDLHNRKGYINAVLERAKRLCPQKEFSTDVFCLSTYDHWLDRKLRHTPKAERATQIEVDGLTINMIWYPFSLIDYILSVKLHKGRIIEPIIFKRNLSRFVDYDLICAHSTIPGEFAYMLYEQYNIPYITTWHGSDVHTAPFVNSNYRDTVKRVMSNGSANLFVSRALMITAKQFMQVVPNAHVSYNGGADIFTKFSDDDKRSLRKKYDIDDADKVVGFVGGLVPIKNVDKLPEIFEYIHERCPNTTFWIVGDGKLRRDIETQLQDRYPHIRCRMFGNQSVNTMPELMNCIDLLLLPSKNEGLPLVTVEAMRCATNVVASNVGGISEVIGPKNVIDHGDGFVERFGHRCVDILQNNEVCPELPKQFDWDTIVDKESKLCKSILQI